MTRKKNYPLLALNLQRSYEVGDLFHPVAAAVGLDSTDHLLAGPWVGEVGCAHLDCARPDEEKLDGVLARHNATDADDRRLDGAGHLSDHTQRNRLDGGP